MTSTNRQESFWDASDLENITKALSVLVKGQNAYGKQHNLTDILAYMRFKLERKFSAERVLWAIDQYTDRNDDIPTPSAINNILDPEPARITEAEFVAAQKWQENNGYPRFSPAYQTILNYNRQQSEAREGPKMDDRFLEIAAANVKRIEE